MVDNDPGTPNQNYAREFLQLFTLGLQELNIDGTPLMGANGNRVPTFTESTVENFSKAFTGWTYAPVLGSGSTGHNPPYFQAPMVPLANGHDLTEKPLFDGVILPAGQSAQQDLAAALHAVFERPSVAPFVSKQLIQHLVTSNPSAAYIARVAKVFENDGKGVRGNLEEVVRQILIDPEARSGDDPANPASPNFGHLREPVLFIANLLRGLNGSFSTPTYIAAASAVLGQNVLNAPSVFSYFPPNFQIAGGAYAPEFALYNTQQSIDRTSTINSAMYAQKLDLGTKFDLSQWAGWANSPNPERLLYYIDLVFFHQSMSAAPHSAIVEAIVPEGTPLGKAQAGLYIALTSSEFNIIH